MKIQMIVGLALVLFGASAYADKEHHGPCAEDAKKFCKGVKPGEGRIMMCLKEHENELSEACKAKSKEAKGKMQEAHKKIADACNSDLEKYCKGVEPGKGRVMKCLKEHKSQLSDTCKAEMKELREAFQAKHGKKNKNKE